jgi:hypothetical protein
MIKRSLLSIYMPRAIVLHCYRISRVIGLSSGETGLIAVFCAPEGTIVRYFSGKARFPRWGELRSAISEISDDKRRMSDK